jgi:hypothetical protein
MHREENVAAEMIALGPDPNEGARRAERVSGSRHARRTTWIVDKSGSSLVIAAPANSMGDSTRMPFSP